MLVKYATRSLDPPDSRTTPLAGKLALRPDTWNSLSAREHDKELILVIRSQLELPLSDTPELASLDQALAACGRLKSTSSIIDLLCDPRFGWKRISPTTLFDSSNSHTTSLFARKVHEALFERWGELDLEGALRTLKNMIPPPERADFDEGMAITFNLYKGAAAAGDGKHALNTLIPPGSKRGYGEHDLCALGYLIEGWARSDPDAAWQTLVSFPPMGNAGRTAIRNYFSGVPPDMNWTALSQKIEEYCAAGQFIAGRHARGEFRRNLAASWIRHEPAAALAWFESNSEDPLSIGRPAENPRIASHAAVINEWLKADPHVATQWLATWQSDGISVPEVLAAIHERQQRVHPNKETPEIREAVEKLLQEAQNR